MNDIITGANVLQARGTDPFRSLTVDEAASLIRFLVREELQEFKNPDELVRIFTKTEAAKVLKISEPSLNKAIKNGEVRCHRIGGRVLFTPEDLKL